MKILILLTLIVAFIAPVSGQQKQAPTCGTPEINRAKRMYRQTSPQVKANAWLAHLLEVRSDGSRTKAQISSIDEVIPYLSADVFDKGKKAIPSAIIIRAEHAFKNEKALISVLGATATLYISKHQPMPLRSTQTVSFTPDCECLFGYSSCTGWLGYNRTCSKISDSGGCTVTAEGCGFLWLSGCNGWCVLANPEEQ